jgi:hypothetical protein
LVFERYATLLQAPKTPGKTRRSKKKAFKTPHYFVNRTGNMTMTTQINLLHNDPVLQNIIQILSSGSRYKYTGIHMKSVSF